MVFAPQPCLLTDFLSPKKMDLLLFLEVAHPLTVLCMFLNELLFAKVPPQSQSFVVTFIHRYLTSSFKCDFLVVSKYNRQKCLFLVKASSEFSIHHVYGQGRQASKQSCNRGDIRCHSIVHSSLKYHQLIIHSYQSPVVCVCDWGWVGRETGEKLATYVRTTFN